jgi:hypothetical protein
MLTSLIRLLWLLAAVLCFFGRLQILPRFYAGRRDPEVQPYLYDLIGHAVFDLSVIIVASVPLLMGTPVPPPIGLILVALLTFGYLAASVPSLLLVRFWLGIGQRQPTEPQAPDPTQES